MRNQSPRADDWAEEALRRYADMVYRLAFAQTRNRQDAEDIFQEVFLRLVKVRPAFESEEHRKAWLIRVTLNASRTLWLSAWRRRMVLMDDEAWNAVPAAEEPEGNGRLEEALVALPKTYRAVIHLFYEEEMTVNGIAEALGVRPGTVRSRLTRARKLLKRYLTDREAEEHVQTGISGDE